jgi:hypothetical protein
VIFCLMAKAARRWGQTFAKAGDTEKRDGGHYDSRSLGLKHHGPDTQAAFRAGRGVALPPANQSKRDYSSVTEPRVSIFSRVFFAASALA